MAEASANHQGEASSVSPDHHQKRQEDLRNIAQLLVNFGVLREDEVFAAYRTHLYSHRDAAVEGGSISSSPPTGLISRSDPSLFRSTRLSSVTSQRRWYVPWSWFHSSSSSKLANRDVTKYRQQSTAPAASADTLIQTSHLEAVVANEIVGQEPNVASLEEPTRPDGVDSDASRAAEAVAEAIQKQAASQQRPPPPIHFEALDEATVSQLQTATRNDRTKLLKLEESTHQMLETIERTKYRYLTPAKSIQCEEEVDGVVACYERLNMQMSVVDGTAPPPTKKRGFFSSASESTEPTQATPISLTQRGRWILNCGTAVEKLDRCTRAILDEYASSSATSSSS